MVRVINVHIFKKIDTYLGQTCRVLPVVTVFSLCFVVLNGINLAL